MIVYLFFPEPMKAKIMKVTLLKTYSHPTSTQTVMEAHGLIGQIQGQGPQLFLLSRWKCFPWTQFLP